MLEKIKNIADWWSEKTSRSKLAILTILIIFGLLYIIYRDGNQHRSDIEDCRDSYKQLVNQLNDVVRRHNDYRMLNDKRYQEMQKDFNNQQIEINSRWLDSYQELFEKVDRIYHEKQIRK